METENVLIGGRMNVNPYDVLMLEAEINYSIIHFVNGKTALVATSLKTLELRFEAFNFYRSHKSFLINIDCIKTYFDQSNQLEMIDEKVVLVSRRKIEGLKKCISQQKFNR